MNGRKTFDELAIAREMEASKENEFTKTAALLYAKYLRYKKVIEAGKSYDNITVEELTEMDSEIEKELIGFWKQTCPEFNYVKSFLVIDSAIETSKKYKLKLPHPTPITQSEWDAIMSIDNDNYRRMLFIMLIEAKYRRLYNATIGVESQILPETKFYVYMNRTEIQRAGGCKFNDQQEKICALGTLHDAGLFDITENKLRLWYIKFVDISNENVIDYITDYDHLDLHYERLSGEKIGTCKTCGRLFRQGKTKPASYCYKHRSNAKMETQKLICIDCGKEFEVGSKSRKKFRCDACQKEYRKRYDRERKAKIKEAV